MKKIIVVIVITLLALPAIYALLKPGFFTSHDGEWMVIRLTAFHQSLRDVQFPVRWSHRLNHEYGYPVLNFLYPLPFYFGEIFYLVSGSFSQAIKWVFIISFPASGITMFTWLKRKYPLWSSLAAAGVYMYTPYRFVDTYVRGSVGESLGFVFIPLIFAAIDLLPQYPYWASLLGAFAIAATILSHNVFVIFVAVAALYGVFHIPKIKTHQLAIMLLLGAALSIYFWLPAIYELRFVRASAMSVANPGEHLAAIKDLIFPSWGYGPSQPGNPQSMSVQVGIVNLVIFAFASLKLWKNRKSKNPETKLLLVISGSSLILMTAISAPLWSIIPGGKIIQFPWRLLAITTFTSAALIPRILIKTKSASLISVVLLAVSIISTLSYAHPRQTTNLPDSAYATNEDTTTVQGEYTSIWMTKSPTERLGDRVLFAHGRGFATDISENNLGMGFKVEASEDGTVSVPIMYYPGWKAVVNGENARIDYSRNGTMAVDVKKGASIISLYWRETRLRQTANYLSLITLLAIISHVFCTFYWEQGKRAPQPKQSRKSR